MLGDVSVPFVVLRDLEKRTSGGITFQGWGHCEAFWMSLPLKKSPKKRFQLLFLLRRSFLKQNGFRGFWRLARSGRKSVHICHCTRPRFNGEAVVSRRCATHGSALPEFGEHCKSCVFYDVPRTGPVFVQNPDGSIASTLRVYKSVEPCLL